jgi:hypothetical protein
VVRDVCAKDQQIVEALNREIERIDFGIRGMQIVQSSQGPSAEFDHDDLGTPLPIGLESHGTRQFVRIYPVLARAPCFAISLRFWQGCLIHRSRQGSSCRSVLKSRPVKTWGPVDGRGHAMFGWRMPA